MTDGGLNLGAEDEEDLAILSAHLQDAVVRVGDLAYLKKSRRFAAFLNRYCWEGCPEGSLGERTRSGLHFNNVIKVQAMNVRQDDPDAIVELLALKFELQGDGGGIIDLLLAGGGRIRLEVEAIDAGLRDISEHWPARARPEHSLGEG
jgi:Protein of unknown function (DUF2948)